MSYIFGVFYRGFVSLEVTRVVLLSYRLVIVFIRGYVLRVFWGGSCGLFSVSLECILVVLF